MRATMRRDAPTLIFALIHGKMCQLRREPVENDKNFFVYSYGKMEGGLRPAFSIMLPRPLFEE
jgi:hypothetical protein